MAVQIAAHFDPTDITLGGVLIATQVRPPEFTRYIWVQFHGTTGVLGYAGTDGAPLANFNLVIAPDELIELQHPGDKAFYLASATAGAVVTVTAVERQ